MPALRSVIFFAFCCYFFQISAQPWIPDNGDGTYKNPVLYADYSDPDVIRVGEDYYLIASSFTCQPGIPVLHSKDLVNWTIINYVYDRLPLQRYEQVQPGQGSWAPSIRFHKGIFYVYFCTPEDGLFLATTNDPAKKWTLTLVQRTGNWEDPCPFWDDDGTAYLIHGRVGAGPAILHKMSADGKRLLDNGQIIYRDDQRQPVLEGFKFMEKRDGYYYFTAPAGGVATGWQSVFRSKDIYGPYEDKVVLQQGATSVNGPHQGGFVQTQTGEWWFLHFQDANAYGRMVHLQPVVWKNGWPVVGKDDDNDGIGEPVLKNAKPNTGKTYPIAAPQTSDEFNSTTYGLQWQWQAAPRKQWWNMGARAGFLRLNAATAPTDSGSLFYAANQLLQKFMAPAFSVTTKMVFNPMSDGDIAGLTVAGNYYSAIALEQRGPSLFVVLYEGKRENRKYLVPKTLVASKASSKEIYFKLTIDKNAMCTYAYSFDGTTYTPFGTAYPAEKGTWIGAKVGLFCLNPGLVSSKGYADFDFFRVTP